MRRLLIALVLFGFISTLTVWGAGRKDNESHEVEDPSGFSEEMDTSEKKQPSKYNFYVEAEDKGGNTGKAGPYNIYLDPESDRPVVTIANPRPYMHVQGNLNIVGTCIDDDAVDFVEIWFNDDIETIDRADGQDFWSYYYDTTQFPDGLYSICVRGTDINGIQGRVKRVLYNLDRKKPLATVKSHELGALVSGKINLSGTVYDGNGVKTLSYSLDNKVRYTSVPLKYDKRSKTSTFQIPLNTSSYDDGPMVIWFKSHDNLGTMGEASHLLFVDNTGPNVQILHPDTTAKVNGVFSIAGYAMDTVGIQSLTWKLGKDSGEFDLIVGNPFWSKDFDLRGQKLGSIDFEIRAVDLSKNVTVVKRKLVVDQDADLPRVNLELPANNAVLQDNVLLLRGMATDNEAVSSLYYQVDANPPVEVPCTGFFQQYITDIPDGVHGLTVWAKDIHGLEGPKVQVRGLTAPGAVPSINISTMRLSGGGKGASSESFYSGKVIHPESNAVLELKINSGSPLANVSWQFGDKSPGQARGSKAGESSFDIPLPADIDYGLVLLRITAADIYGRGASMDEYVYITDLTTINPDEAAAVVDNSANGALRLESLGTSLWQSGMGTTLPRNSRQGINITAAVSTDQAVTNANFTIGGRAIKGAAKASSGGGFQISAVVPPDLPAGRTPVSLDVQLRSGESLKVSGEFFILRPDEGRAVNTGRDFQWARADRSLGDNRILISQNSEPLSGVYAGRPVVSANLSGSGSESFSVSVEDGIVLLRANREGNFGPVSLSVTDKDGRNVQVGNFRFIVDFNAPTLTLTDTSVYGKWVQNSVAVRFAVSDANSVSSIDWSPDLGETWTSLGSGSGSADRTLNISNIEDGSPTLLLRAKDDAGRITVRPFTVNKDTVAPEAELIIPFVDAQVNGTILMGMTIKEAGKLSSISYDRGRGASRQVYSDTAPTIGEDGQAIAPDAPPFFLSVLMDRNEMPLDDNMKFTFTDLSGNVAVLDRWHFDINNEVDIPVVTISLPLDNEVVTADFNISGITVDDDAIRGVYWRIDNAPDQFVECENGYSIPVSLASLIDNEHTITIVAEDIYGVKSPPEKRPFRVSLEEPKAAMLLPSYDQIVRDTVTLSGTASDRNGIELIQISLDNGNSYNDARGTTSWNYQFNSTVIDDGTHVVFMRVYDKYGISGLYSTLINIDNTAPEVVVDSPKDGMVTTGNIYLTGRSIDNVLMRETTIEVRSLQGNSVPANIARRTVPPGSILMQNLDLTPLRDGIYNIEVVAVDKAENVTRVSRNVQLAKDSLQNFVDILYPLDGEHVQGAFNIYGITGGNEKASTVTLYINDQERETVDVTEAGYYRFAINGEDMDGGLTRIRIRGDFGGRNPVSSPERTYLYQGAGAWVTIDSLNMGDFAFERPWLNGRAGYSLSEQDEEILVDKKADKEFKAAVAAKKLDKVELSFDNGKTFVNAGKAHEKGVDWRYRLETGEMTEGMHYLIVRATMANGEIAVSRTLVQVDKTPPVIRLISPQPGMHYNTSLEYTALASDDVALKTLSYHLRKGDLAAYEVPGFLQGMYIDVALPPFIKQIANDAPLPFDGGTTYMDFGMGLSFFDDNVKVQVQYGFLTQQLYESMGGDKQQPGGEVTFRYGGDVLGIKLLASVYSLPFASFAGPDFEWLSANFAIGANFSLFSTAQSGTPTWMTAMLLQVEFPKAQIPKRKNFRTFSMFTEGQLWFVPTDVDAEALGIKTTVPHVIMGLRMYIF